MIASAGEGTRTNGSRILIRRARENLSGVDAQSASGVGTSSRGQRLQWLDGIKGIAILWIVLFHFFASYANDAFPSPLASHYFAAFIHRCAPASHAAMVECIARAIIVAISMAGRQGVHVFLVMSGFGLAYSLARTGNPENGWRGWYKSRVLRLFPLYWLAHIIYLVSPFQARYEPIDYRFILSFLGDRICPVSTIFYYANAAWWYVGLILELYLIFPLLFRLLQKAGAGWFLVICGVETIVSRYLLLFVIPASSNYLIGAFCGCRLWEFAFGMVMGLWYRQNHAWVDEHLFSFGVFIAGIVIYTAGLYSYTSTIAYTVTDGLVGTGLFVILAQIAYQGRRLPRVEAAIAYVGAYSYGLYLIHEPYVLYLGTHMRGINMVEFLLIAAAVMTFLAIVCAKIEQFMDKLTDRVMGREVRTIAAEGATT
jgi:peptidoglycan/LPS O-acetylase OafA/YrhL